MKKKGKGIASQIYGTHIINTPNPTGAFIEVYHDGTVQLTTSTTDIGQGSDTVFSQICAEELGVPLNNVNITSGDSETGPYDVASCASRATYVAGNAVRLAAQEARQKLLEVAGDMLVEDPSALEAEDGRIFVKGTPEKNVLISEVASKSHGEGKLILGSASFNPKIEPMDPETGEGVASAGYHYCAQLAEVEVDTDTGEVKVEKFVASSDVGQAINPAMVKGQVRGGVQMGIGFALMEKMQFDEKYQCINPNLTDYIVPTAKDVPNIEVIIVEEPEPTGPFGAKGTGEATMLPTAPAICNAIYDAVGVRIESLPATPEKILKGLKKK